MKEKYSYELTNNGYYILINGEKVIHQYEPYIPNKSLNYEENAKKQIDELLIMDYLTEITNGTKTIEDVPEELKENVQGMLKEQEEARQNEPATVKDYKNLQTSITDIELALAEIYEMGVQK